MSRKTPPITHKVVCLIRSGQIHVGLFTSFESASDFFFMTIDDDTVTAVEMYRLEGCMSRVVRKYDEAHGLAN